MSTYMIDKFDFDNLIFMVNEYFFVRKANDLFFEIEYNDQSFKIRRGIKLWIRLR